MSLDNVSEDQTASVRAVKWMPKLSIQIWRNRKKKTEKFEIFYVLQLEINGMNKNKGWLDGYE